MIGEILLILLQIIQTLIYSSITTMGRLMVLAEQLLLQLEYASQVGGPLGLALALGILAVAVFFLARHIMGLGKHIILLFFAGVAIAALIIIGML